MSGPAASAGAPPEIEGYDRFSPLGEGGTATVWSARQIALGREVAIKTLDPELVSGDAEAKPGAGTTELVLRFRHGIPKPLVLTAGR